MRAMSLAAAFRRISGLTGISRILGFLRDVAFAAFLGPARRRMLSLSR